MPTYALVNIVTFKRPEQRRALTRCVVQQIGVCASLREILHHFGSLISQRVAAVLMRPYREQPVECARAERLSSGCDRRGNI